MRNNKATSSKQPWSVDNYIKQRDYYQQYGLYDPRHESAACGVGLVASTKGEASRNVVNLAINALKALWHRGAVDADGKTGDGAGMHLSIPKSFFANIITEMGYNVPTNIAVGMIFLPRDDFALQEKTRQIIETILIDNGFRIYGWRQVPVNIMVIGEKANSTRPDIEQILLEWPSNLNQDDAETALYRIRRYIEKTWEKERINDSYICSLSSYSIIYKGLFLAEQLDSFYPDLCNENFISSFAIYHQRYSTNTFPSWSLAQPFRVLAHNGEINTLSGNYNWMKSHETLMENDILGDINDILPIIQPSASDSFALDNVFEVMVHSGRELPEVKTILMPEAWENNPRLNDDVAALYHYAHGIMEPWDGPAAICAFAGKWLVAGLDRNGLRPLRYHITHDDIAIVGSEAGMVRIDDANIAQKGRVGPGQMIAINIEDGSLYYDGDLKQYIATRRPYKKWLKNINYLHHLEPYSLAASSYDDSNLVNKQIMAGWSYEDLELILHPMAESAKEATGSMGDDSPLAVLSKTWRGLHRFFRQNFAQVTNPPIDSLRERNVMSLSTRLNNLGNTLHSNETQLDFMELPSPILLDGELHALYNYMNNGQQTIDCCFAPNATSLEQAIHAICQEAERLVRSGKHYIMLDNTSNTHDIAIPMILVTSAVHNHLSHKHLRTFVTLHIICDEALDTHHFAVLIGVGATTVTPRLAVQTIINRHNNNLLDIQLEQALANYKKSIEDGLLKIMAKMGISVISSYRGGCIFEAIGLSRAMVSKFFPGLLSRISGIGLNGLEQLLIKQHHLAYGDNNAILPIGGYYRFRRNNEPHAWEANAIHMLQHAVLHDSYRYYQKYVDILYALPPIHIRDLCELRFLRDETPLEHAESITNIRKRLIAPGISLGALSPIAHETLSVAMNRIGAKSDSGEGGEDARRYKPRANGDNASSAIKQVASGRFGVTIEYLNNCKEIEIKMAQGAKPGEGGQLPGFKVSSIIAKLRHSTQGVTLISPPPHHDIYSIEDLAQLIYDLKQANPQARVCVKLVARSGIGTIAAGVAKAHADTILISGHSGGTGASPQTSIKYAGLPWEIGLAEAHQVLCLNNLRDRVTLRVDGGIKTGRDVIIAAMLGAEEYGIGTASLIAMGCLMVRQCHTNTCPVGVCTQDDELIKKFGGTPEKVVNLFSFIAEEVRELLAKLGFTRLEDIIGRSDLLHQSIVKSDDLMLDTLDLNPILARAEHNIDFSLQKTKHRNDIGASLDDSIIIDAKSMLDDGEKMALSYDILNTNRSVGTKLSSAMYHHRGINLPDHHLTLKLRGIAGQSLGAFAIKGLTLDVIGEANDYVGKGLSGAHIIIRPTFSSNLVAHDNTIIGNTCLYGATSGYLYAAGQAGERFAVRNSGAHAVIEGCGNNGCEYMTGGVVTILNMVGNNFAAGMTGGMAFIYDEHSMIEHELNHETVGYYDVDSYWQDYLYKILEQHHHYSLSKRAAYVMQNWHNVKHHFKHIIPHEIKESIINHSTSLTA